MESKRVRRAERYCEGILQEEQRVNGFIRFHPISDKIAAASRITTTSLSSFYASVSVCASFESANFPTVNASVEIER